MMKTIAFVLAVALVVGATVFGALQVDDPSHQLQAAMKSSMAAGGSGPVALPAGPAQHDSVTSTTTVVSLLAVLFGLVAFRRNNY